MKFSLFITILSFCALGSAKAKSPYTFYYLTIGCENYERDESKFYDQDFIPFDELPQASTSARTMETLLKQSLKAKGFNLSSTEQNLITKTRIFSSLAKLDAQIKNDKAAKPFIIFYYCGHGTSDNLAMSQILIPGDFTISEKEQKSNQKDRVNVLKQHIILLRDISDYFEKRKYSYMLLVDCCRQTMGKDVRKIFLTVANEQYDKVLANEDWINEMKKAGASDEDFKGLKANFDTSMKDMLKQFNTINEYHQSNAVVFATTPGKEAEPVHFPHNNIIKLVDRDNEEDIGPVCRRTILAFEKFYNSKNLTYTIRDFVNDLKDIKLDKESVPSISGYEEETEEHDQEFIFLSKGL
jgi:hypothetical protein